jgi:hypothetical protein
MFQIWGIIGTLANLAIIAVVGYFFITKYRAWQEENAPRWEHEQKKVRLRGVAVIHPKDGNSGHVDVHTANKRNLEFGKTPGFRAGQTIMELPTVDPLKEKGSTTDRTIVGVLRMVVYRRSGEESSDIAVTDKGGMAGLFGGKQYVFNPLTLTSRQSQRVEDERQEVIERGDKIMPNLLGDGRDWTISRAMGKNKNPKTGQHDCSYLQVTSALGEKEGFGFPLTPRILDLEEHDMFDVLATNDQDDEVFFAFWAADTWHCFLGRELTESEVSSVTIV